jgi:hypothetical protein
MTSLVGDGLGDLVWRTGDARLLVAVHAADFLSGSVRR